MNDQNKTCKKRSESFPGVLGDGLDGGGGGTKKDHKREIARRRRYSQRFQHTY